MLLEGGSSLGSDLDLGLIQRQGFHSGNKAGETSAAACPYQERRVYVTQATVRLH